MPNQVCSTQHTILYSTHPVTVMDVDLLIALLSSMNGEQH